MTPATCGDSAAVAPRRLNRRARRALIEQTVERLLEAVQRAIDTLDQLDGDCEGEGAQCDDEGFDSDHEPDEGGGGNVEYADDGHGGQDQSRYASDTPSGVAPSPLGAR